MLLSENGDHKGLAMAPSRVLPRSQRIVFFIILVVVFAAWFYFLEYPTIRIVGGSDWSFYGSPITTFFPNANPFQLHLGAYETFGNSTSASSGLSEKWQGTMPVGFAGAPNIPLLVVPVLLLTYFFGGRKHLKAGITVSIAIALFVLF